MHYHLDTTQKVGTTIGAIMGFAQNAAEKVLPNIDTGITSADLVETTVLAGLGAAVGFFVTNGLKTVKNWWVKRKVQQ